MRTPRVLKLMKSNSNITFTVLSMFLLKFLFLFLVDCHYLIIQKLSLLNIISLKVEAYTKNSASVLDGLFNLWCCKTSVGLLPWYM